MMLPVVTRASQEVIAVVPSSLREAALALGAPRWRVILRVVLPTARAGLSTAVILGVARIAGETAPVLFAAGGACITTGTHFPGNRTTFRSASSNSSTKVRPTSRAKPGECRSFSSSWCSGFSSWPASQVGRERGAGPAVAAAQGHGCTSMRPSRRQSGGDGEVVDRLTALATTTKERSLMHNAARRVRPHVQEACECCSWRSWPHASPV